MPQPQAAQFPQARYKLVVAVMLIAIIALGISLAVVTLPNAIFKTSSTPSGFTFLHGTVTGNSPRSIEFWNASDSSDKFVYSISNGAYQITLKSNVLYKVVIDLNVSPYLCYANPGTVVPSGSAGVQNFGC